MEVSEEYKEFWKAAMEIAVQDVKDHPLRKNELNRDRVKRHLLGMVEMYEIKYGNEGFKRAIVNYLDRKIKSLPGMSAVGLYTVSESELVKIEEDILQGKESLEER